MRVPEKNGHIHDFDISLMKPSDHFHDTKSFLNGQNDSDFHDHDIFIFFDSEKQKFVITTGVGGGTFATQHTHPDFEVAPGELDGGLLESLRQD